MLLVYFIMEIYLPGNALPEDNKTICKMSRGIFSVWRPSPPPLLSSHSSTFISNFFLTCLETIQTSLFYVLFILFFFYFCFIIYSILSMFSFVLRLFYFRFLWLYFIFLSGLKVSRNFPAFLFLIFLIVCAEINKLIKPQPSNTLITLININKPGQV